MSFISSFEDNRKSRRFGRSIVSESLFSSAIGKELRVLVDDRVEIKAWKDDDTGPAALTFRIESNDSTATENEQWPLAICQTLPLLELVSLTLSGWRSSGWSLAWRQIFGNLSHLRSIKLVGKWHVNLTKEEDADGRSAGVLYSIFFSCSP